jgi:hypothetical protein
VPASRLRPAIPLEKLLLTSFTPGTEKVLVRNAPYGASPL